MEQASAMVKLILFYYTRQIDWESVRKWRAMREG